MIDFEKIGQIYGTEVLKEILSRNSSSYLKGISNEYLNGIIKGINKFQNEYPDITEEDFMPENRME